MFAAPWSAPAAAFSSPASPACPVLLFILPHDSAPVRQVRGGHRSQAGGRCTRGAAARRQRAGERTHMFAWGPVACGRWTGASAACATGGELQQGRGLAWSGHRGLCAGCYLGRTQASQQLRSRLEASHDGLSTSSGIAPLGFLIRCIAHNLITRCPCRTQTQARASPWLRSSAARWGGGTARRSATHGLPPCSQACCVRCQICRYGRAGPRRASQSVLRTLVLRSELAFALSIALTPLLPLDLKNPMLCCVLGDGSILS